MACLTNEVLWAYLEQTLPEPAVRAVESHVAGCAACLALVGEGARLAFPDDPRREPGDGDVALAPGSRVGRYEIVGPRGAGAAGLVYEAHDPQLRRRVALKLLRPSIGTDGSPDGARLLAEAQSMARVADPHVVAVYDAGTHAGPRGDEVFVVMELVEGQTLADWLAAAPRGWREILDVFVQAGRGLAAIHAAGIVHRDFKPNNVLIGSDGRARVTDFGLARPPHWPALLPPGAPAGEVAVAGAGDAPTSVAGTPLYMAPEQYRGEAVTARTDQFGFAVALSWALHRRHPFLGSTPSLASVAELARRVTGGALEPVTGDDVPGAVDEVLRRALTVDPRDRHPSMEALLAALTGAASPTRRWWRLGRWAAAPVALAAVAAILVAWRAAAARCGDGRVDSVEECDDGNARDDDGCTTRCLACGGARPGVAWAANGGCYVRHDQPLPFAAAVEVCRREDAELVTLSGIDETEVLVSVMGRDDDRGFWLGLSRTRSEEGFQWLTGERMRAEVLMKPRFVETAESLCAVTLPRSRAGNYPMGWAAVACDTPRPFVCERAGWTTGDDGHRYRLFAGALSWHAARAACEARGAHLLTIDDAREQDAVAARTFLPVWMGISKVGGRGWQTVTGGAARLWNLAPGEPDYRGDAACLVMDTDRRWYDRACNDRNGYVCELDR